MSLQLYSQIPGTQVKRDVNLSNATIQCDPKLLFPEGASQGGVPLNKENLAGKIAVEHDICNLDVNNLTVNGVLKAKSPAEICDIVCPVDFILEAGDDIIMRAADIALLVATNQLLLVADDGASSADIQINATRDIFLKSERYLALKTGSRGVNIEFNPSSSTSNLKMTSANVNSTGANPAAQTVTANAVHGTITMSQNTVINGIGGATDVISCTLTNDRIAANSTVLYSVNIAGSNSERIVINGGGTTAGSYEFVLANLGASPANDYASNATNLIVISFLVINPADSV